MPNKKKHKRFPRWILSKLIYSFIVHCAVLRRINTTIYNQRQKKAQILIWFEKYIRIYWKCSDPCCVDYVTYIMYKLKRLIPNLSIGCTRVVCMLRNNNLNIVQNKLPILINFKIQEPICSPKFKNIKKKKSKIKINDEIRKIIKLFFYRFRPFQDEWNQHITHCTLLHTYFINMISNSL